MSVDSFEKTSLGWQMQQFQQRIGEWLELNQQRFIKWLEKLFQPQPNQRESSPPSWLINLFNSLPPWLPDLLNLLFRAALWLVLTGLLSWLAVKLLRQLSPYFYSLRSRRRSLTGQPLSNSATGLTASGWLQRSRDFYRQGNYREACRTLYLAMLQKLHDAGIAPHQSSRTDGEYLQLVQQMPQYQSYKKILNTHEQLCFNNADISAELFEQCQQAYRNIEAQEAKRQ